MYTCGGFAPWGLAEGFAVLWGSLDESEARVRGHVCRMRLWLPSKHQSGANWALLGRASGQGFPSSLTPIHGHIFEVCLAKGL